MNHPPLVTPELIDKLVEAFRTGVRHGYQIPPSGELTSEVEYLIPEMNMAYDAGVNVGISTRMLHEHKKN